MISGPIIEDQVAMRLAVDHRRSQSPVAFLAYPGVEDPGEYRSRPVRGKALIEPKRLDGLSNLLPLTHTEPRAPQTAGVPDPPGAAPQGVAKGTRGEAR